MKYGVQIPLKPTMKLFCRERISDVSFIVRLEHASIVEAVVAFVADDDMIEHSDPHDLANFFEPAGDLDVFLAGCGIAAGVIVNEYNRSR
jgi:7-keto-8-aminopelargonate synthetase-like enzyme